MTSPLITDSHSNDTDANDKIRLMGCKKPIAIKDLRRNRVPASQALGSGKNGSRFRPKVVAHFLGLEGIKGDASFPAASWGAVKVETVKKYTLESCDAFCRDMKWDRIETNTNTSTRKQTRIRREDLPTSEEQCVFLAMQEASIVMCKPQYDPVNLCTSLKEKREFDDNTKRHGNKHLHDEEEEEKCSKKLKQTANTEEENSVHASTSNKKETVSALASGEDLEGMTPENFDDWRLGGNTQKNSSQQSQTQNFSQQQQTGGSLQ